MDATAALRHGRALWQCRNVARLTAKQRIDGLTFSTFSAVQAADGRAGYVHNDVVDAVDTLTPSSSDNGVVGTLADAFLAIQPPEHLTYAGLIVAATLALRCTVTLPVTFWQRRRIDRVQNVVTPLVQQWMANERYALRAEYRKLNKSYEEYTAEFQRRTKAEFKRLSAIHGCRSLPTLLVPPLVHLPVFITCTLVLREASLRSYKALESAASPVGQEGVLDVAETSQAASLAMESFQWCHSLADVDPLLVLPLAVSLALLANTEVQAGLRAKLAQTRALEAQQAALEQAEAAPLASFQPVATRPVAVAHPAVAQMKAAVMQVPHKQVRKRRASTRAGLNDVNHTSISGNPPSAAAIPSIAQTQSTQSTQSMHSTQSTQKILTNLLRAFSILFLPIGAFAPVAVNLYWLTSNLFSVVQNIALAYLDSRKAVKR